MIVHRDGMGEGIALGFDDTAQDLGGVTGKTGIIHRPVALVVVDDVGIRLDEGIFINGPQVEVRRITRRSAGGDRRQDDGEKERESVFHIVVRICLHFIHDANIQNKARFALSTERKHGTIRSKYQHLGIARRRISPYLCPR